VLNALELVSSLDADFHEEIVGLLAHVSPKVRIAAVRLLGSAQKMDDLERIRALLDDPDETVRAAAIGAYCALGREAAIRIAAPFLQDPSIPVRGAAVAALIKHGGLDGILMAAESLKSFLQHPDPRVRLQAARILREIEVKNFFQPVLELLSDSDPSVRLSAVEAAGAMHSPELIEPLAAALGRHETAEAAVRALAAYGASIERSLFAFLHDSNQPIEVRRKVPRVLAEVGEQESVSQLLNALDDPDTELRIAIARAATKIRERSPRVRADDRILDQAIKSEIKDAYQALATIEDLGLGEKELLPEALFRRHRTKLGLAFRLLSIRYPARTIQLVYSNLDAESKAVRANALEVVDNVLSKEESRLLIPLLEDGTRLEKVRRGAELFPLERHAPAEWLKILISDPHAWIVTCTLYLIGDWKMTELFEDVKRHALSHDAIVRETSHLASERLKAALDTGLPQRA
jgi:HEAT repeat protein